MDDASQDNFRDGVVALLHESGLSSHATEELIQHLVGMLEKGVVPTHDQMTALLGVGHDSQFTTFTADYKSPMLVDFKDAIDLKSDIEQGPERGPPTSSCAQSVDTGDDLKPPVFSDAKVGIGYLSQITGQHLIDQQNPGPPITSSDHAVIESGKNDDEKYSKHYIHQGTGDELFPEHLCSVDDKKSLLPTTNLDVISDTSNDAKVNIDVVGIAQSVYDDEKMNLLTLIGPSAAVSISGDEDHRSSPGNIDSKPLTISNSDVDDCLKLTTKSSSYAIQQSECVSVAINQPIDREERSQFVSDAKRIKYDFTTQTTHQDVLSNLPCNTSQEGCTIQRHLVESIVGHAQPDNKRVCGNQGLNGMSTDWLPQKDVKYGNILRGLFTQPLNLFTNQPIQEKGTDDNEEEKSSDNNVTQMAMNDCSLTQPPNLLEKVDNVVQNTINGIVESCNNETFDRNCMRSQRISLLSFPPTDAEENNISQDRLPISNVGHAGLDNEIVYDRYLNKKSQNILPLSSGISKPSGDFVHRCKSCGVRYNWKSNLRRHIREKHGGNLLLEEKIPYAEPAVKTGSQHTCSICDEPFASSNDLLKHVKEQHKGMTQSNDDLESGSNEILNKRRLRIRRLYDESESDERQSGEDTQNEEEDLGLELECVKSGSNEMLNKRRLRIRRLYDESESDERQTAEGSGEETQNEEEDLGLELECVKSGSNEMLNKRRLRIRRLYDESESDERLTGKGSGEETQNEEEDLDLELECVICNKAFITSNGLKNHSLKCKNVENIKSGKDSPVSTLSGNFVHRCKSCGMQCNRKFSLKRHIRKKHGGNFSLIEKIPCDETSGQPTSSSSETQLQMPLPIQNGGQLRGLD